MYLWNVNALIEDLRNDAVSQKAQFKYLFLTVLLWTVFSDTYWSQDMAYNKYDVIISFSSIVIIIIELLLFYRINTNGDNKDLIPRYICLSIPVGIRTLVFFIPLFIIGVIGESRLYYENFDDYLNAETYVTTPVLAALITLFGIAFVVYLLKSLKKVAH